MSRAGFATKRARVGLMLGVAGWAFAVTLGQAGLWRHVDAPVYDATVRSSASMPADPRVVAVYVGDADITAYQAEHGRWPWHTRMLHAQVARTILSGGARTLGYDIHFSEPSIDEEFSDEELTIELADRDDGVDVVHGTLFLTGERAQIGGGGLTADAAAALASEGGTYGTTSEQRAAFTQGRTPIVPIDTLFQASTALGHTNPSPDFDFAIRRVPLFIAFEDRLYPSLAMRMAMSALGLTEDRVVIDVDAREVRLEPEGDDTVHVPIDPDGTTWIRYDRPKEEFDAVLYSLTDRAAREGVFDGAHVIVGVSVSAATDTWRTPMDAQHQGFMIHAQILENLLTGRFVRAIQPDVNPSGSRELGLHVGLFLAALGIAFVASAFDPRFGWPTTLIGAAVPLVVSVVLLRTTDTWVPPTTAVAALGGAGVLGVGYRQFSDVLERRRLRRVYERYLSPAVLEAVLRDPELLQLGGARKELTVFFSDIRGFTPYSETVEPMELTERLNEYYGEMIGLAHEHGATVDKLIGDSLMAFYGDPVTQPDHALRAVYTALDTQARLRALTVDWESRGVHVFGVGIGIATGDVAVGNLGSETFVDYTVVGSVVNLAARLQGDAKAGEILIGPRTYELVKDEIDAESLGERAFKGIAGPQQVYRVTGRRSGVAGSSLG